MEVIKKNKRIVIIIMSIIFVAGIFGVIYLKNQKNDNINVSSFIDEKINNNYNETQVIDGNNYESDNKEQNENTNEVNDNSKLNGAEKIYIHIIGEVNNQGVIELNKGDRIVDAIEKAGGATEKADLSKINLVFILDDGQKVRIPSINDKSENESYVTDGSGNEVLGGGVSNMEIQAIKKVNINTANQTELETLSGIGPSLAANIIEFRNKNGFFKSVDELKNVSGIGEAKFDKIKNNIRVK